jgi:hypothetical protein
VVGVGLVGGPGRWPHKGAFRGASGGLSFAGRVGADDLVDAYDAARAAESALGGPWPTDRRAALTAAWDRVLAGAVPADGLVLLLVAEDDGGVALSGVGLGAVAVLDGPTAIPVVASGHPLLGPAGAPTRRPGALTLPARPEWVVASAWGEDLGTSDLLARAGVW